MYFKFKIHETHQTKITEWHLSWDNLGEQHQKAEPFWI